MTRSLLLLCLAPLTVYAANEHYLGYAYDAQDGSLRYQEEHWVMREAGRQQRLVLYRCPDGRAFARKWVRGAVDDPAPDFTLYDERDGYREGVATRDGQRYVYVQASAGATMQSRQLPATAGAVIDAGFDPWLRSNWDAPPSPMAFLVPSRQAYLDLSVNARDLPRDGERSFRLRLDAWYGFAAPPLQVFYDSDGRRLRRFEGLSNLRDANGGTQTVRIEFPPEAMQPPPSAQAVNAASETPLVRRCD